ncbi:hypothetical protein [Pseudomonas sp.]|uniref:hypothetical protein n=1 Tax=Pseudomonas sp. TaxID=306 RepID=UPI003FD81DED
MSIVTDLAMGTASAAVKKTLLPWLLVACMLALGSVGAAGMWGGYEIANARNAKDREAILQAHIEVADAQRAAFAQAVLRGNEASTTFLEELRGIKIVNTTITNEVRKETEKLVYTDCKLPDTGAALLKKNVDAVNMRLLGKKVTK